MPATILDGKETAAAMRAELTDRVAAPASADPRGVGPMTRSMLLQDVVLGAGQAAASGAQTA